MALLTTPDERFGAVPDYDRESAYVEVDVDPADGEDEPDPLIAYVDVEPAEGARAGVARRRSSVSTASRRVGSSTGR